MLVNPKTYANGNNAAMIPAPKIITKIPPPQQAKRERKAGTRPNNPTVPLYALQLLTLDLKPKRYAKKVLLIPTRIEIIMVLNIASDDMEKIRCLSR